MKIFTSLALLTALVACEQQRSPLDKITATKPAATESSPAGAAPGAPTAPTALKIDRSGTVEQQLARLQDAYDRNAEVLDVLNKEWSRQKEQHAAQDRETPAPDAMFAVDVAEDVKAGQVDGPADAPVTIVKAFDFACPYCQQASPTMRELVKDYAGKVRVVYTNMLIHPPARTAHLASCGAAKQGKYMAFKDAFWDKGFGPYAASGGKDAAPLGEDNVLTIAKGIGLDADKLKADMHSPECTQRMQDDMSQMQKFHVNSTPTFFINGKVVDGALPKEQFKQIIDEELKKVDGSGVPGAQYYDKVVLAKGEKQFRSKMEPKPN